MKKNDRTIPIITLDGPSGTGKGTISQKLALHLGWNYLDSGAIYRALAYTAAAQHINLDHIDELVDLAHHLNLKFCGKHIYINDEDITEKIRSEACGQNASKIGAIPQVREALLKRQRAFAMPPGLVTDGRDMGTVVFPHANLKIFLHASPEERANRRLLQLKTRQNNDNLAQVLDQLVERDERDVQRTCAPLQPAKDAIEVDTTYLSIDQVFAKVLNLAMKHCILKGGS